MARQPILVVGAGPTGLMLALWLARLGCPVRIIDKDAGPGETSRAMAVQARTLEFHRQLGFADEAVRRGLTIDRLDIREAGKLEGSVPLGDLGRGISAFPFVLSLPQDVHEALLIEQLGAAGVAVERRTALTGFVQEKAGITAQLSTPSGEETVETPFIAGCDGAHSAVRTLSGIALPGGTYAQRFFVADALVEGEAASAGMNLCLTGQDFCLAIPLRSPGEARLIGIVPDEAGDEAGFADVEPSVKRNTGLIVHRVNWFSTYKVHHRVAERFRDRRAFLLGDAAHLHSPAGGQGMNTGLGDAVNLAWKLAAVEAERADPALLDSFEAERIPFARRLVSTTDRMFQLVTDRGLLGKGWRTIVMAHALPLAFKVPIVPRTAFRIVSQTEIAYRDSPLSEGRAGAVEAGDRLPWVDGVDNHAPLDALDWQVHVWGDPTPSLRAVAAARRLPLHAFAWGPEAEAGGFARNAVYLVRPDGHVGLAAGADGADAVPAYLDRLGLRSRA